MNKQNAQAPTVLGHLVKTSWRGTPSCTRCDTPPDHLSTMTCASGIVVHVDSPLEASYWGNNSYVPVPAVDGHPVGTAACGPCTAERDKKYGGPTPWAAQIDGDWDTFKKSLQHQPSDDQHTV